MKLKIGILAIIISTVAIIGVMNLALKNGEETTASTASEQTKTKEQKKPSAKLHSFKIDPKTSTNVDAIDNEDDDDNDDDDEDARIVQTNKTDAQLTEADINKIKGIAGLSEAQLTQELDVLKDRIEEEDLFGKLEDGLLPKEKETEAKETLERFALLGLETTRRKYMDIEPELKDPVYAYKDSLLEIREMLNDDLADD